MRLDHTKSFECWVDDDYAGICYEPGAAKDPMTVNSRSGCVIACAGCPITWSSKLQTLTVLSTTEAEYIALSSALRDQILIMQRMKEVIKQARVTPCVLHDFRGQWRINRACLATQDMTLNEAHQ